MSLIEIVSNAVMGFLNLVADGLATVVYVALVAIVIGLLATGGILAIIKIVYPAVKGLYGIISEAVSGDKQPTFGSNTNLPQ